jgi:uncharacterized iron-regulated protein
MLRRPMRRRRLLCAGLLGVLSLPMAARACIAPGTWLRPDGRGPVAAEALYAYAVRQRVVLLGESHDVAAHHRWQLETLSALHVRRVDLVLGFEMFPRRVQPVLDRWVAGALSEADFLEQSDWAHVWRFDAELYLPLFRFARDHAVPMRALNVEQTLVREVGARGFDAVPVAQREGVSRPAPASSRYVAHLHEIYARHARGSVSDDALERFVGAQLLWDRAMAEGISAALAANAAALVVGILGRGHIEYGFGVPHQLAALGIRDVLTLLPEDMDASCESPPADIADVVYGVPIEEPEAAPPADGAVDPGRP